MKRAVIDIDGDETSHKRRRFNFTLPFSWKGDEAPYMGPIDLDYSLPDESESESCSGCKLSNMLLFRERVEEVCLSLAQSLFSQLPHDQQNARP